MTMPAFLAAAPSRAQPRWHSAAEAVANVAIGYAVAVAAQAVVFPAFGIHVSLGDNLAIGACFTAVSLARSYAIRRIAERFRA